MVRQLSVLRRREALRAPRVDVSACGGREPSECLSGIRHAEVFEDRFFGQLPTIFPVVRDVYFVARLWGPLCVVHGGAVRRDNLPSQDGRIGTVQDRRGQAPYQGRLSFLVHRLGVGWSMEWRAVRRAITFCSSLQRCFRDSAIGDDCVDRHVQYVCEWPSAIKRVVFNDCLFRWAVSRLYVPAIAPCFQL